MATLHALPPEIIHHVLTYLPSTALTKCAATSRKLSPLANDSLLWEALVRTHIPSITWHLPSSASSWKDLYISHHPYWFLPQHKIWISDALYYGGLILAQFSPGTGAIEARRLLARDATDDTGGLLPNMQWKVTLYPGEKAIKLDYCDRKEKSILQEEVQMDVGLTRQVITSISLCKNMPVERQHHSMALWPPRSIPAVQRVRRESVNKFRDAAQRPSKLREVSDQTFRLRKCIDTTMVGAEFRVADEVSTWSTLLAESYTPTKEKEWQGIWVGDYSAHGFEFLLVMQTSPDEGPRLRRHFAPATMSGLPSGFKFSEVVSDDVDYERELCHGAEVPPGAPRYSRLEAVKLTGDPNVPRGEVTWFADDISDGGLVRVESDGHFRGARVVRGFGHVADRGFENDRFISSELIMVSHNMLAQRWQAFDHISYYKRIDIDDIMAKGTCMY